MAGLSHMLKGREEDLIRASTAADKKVTLLGVALLMISL